MGLFYRKTQKYWLLSDWVVLD